VTRLAVNVPAGDPADMSAANVPAGDADISGPNVPAGDADISGPNVPAGRDGAHAAAADVAAALRIHIRDIPDYPQAGVIFKDISPLLADPQSFAAAVDAVAGRHEIGSVDKVVGIEARGFILAAPIAYHLRAGFVPVRKAGKLPAATYAESYALEYGSATVEVHRDAFGPGDRVLVVDDVLATGGTAAATRRLVERAGAVVTSLSVLIELVGLHGRDALPGLAVSAVLSV